jgi:hypothetical protein
MFMANQDDIRWLALLNLKRVDDDRPVISLDEKAIVAQPGNVFHHIIDAHHHSLPSSTTTKRLLMNRALEKPWSNS